MIVQNSESAVGEGYRDLPVFHLPVGNKHFYRTDLRITSQTEIGIRKPGASASQKGYSQGTHSSRLNVTRRRTPLFGGQTVRAPDKVTYVYIPSPRINAWDDACKLL